LTVLNPSFESDLTPTGTFRVLQPANWALHDPSGIVDQGIDAVGVLNPLGTTFFPAGSPDGANAALIFLAGDIGGGEVGLRQTLSSNLTANTSYTLRVAVGNIASGIGGTPPQFFDLDGFPGYAVQLRAGGTLLAEDRNTLSIAEGAFAESIVQFDVGASHPQLGLPLEIHLLNLNIPGTPAEPGIEVDFDDVRLDAVNVPEPSTLTLALLAFAGLALRRPRVL
jgi:hypothetical protein